MPVTYVSYADLDADYEDIDCADCGVKFYVDPQQQAAHPVTRCWECRKDRKKYAEEHP